MRKMTRADVLNIAEYEKIRPEYRARIIAEKAKRRIQVGPFFTLLFENFATMLYQVQEMMRAERIVHDHAIQAELDVYNELVPDLNEVSFSLLIEINDIAKRQNFLALIVDLAEHTFLQTNGKKILATFDSRQGSATQLSSVQYVKIKLTPSALKALQNPASEVKIVFAHPYYSHHYLLTAELKALLWADATNPDR